MALCLWTHVARARTRQVLWVEADVLRENVDEYKKAHTEAEAAAKAVKAQVLAREQACKPLEEGKTRYEKEVRTAKKKSAEADEERVGYQGPLERAVAEVVRNAIKLVQRLQEILAFAGIESTPELANWLASLYPTKQLVICSYIYQGAACLPSHPVGLF